MYICMHQSTEGSGLLRLVIHLGDNIELYRTFFTASFNGSNGHMQHPLT